jgi:Leucine-rich repeat (LRR) protein
MLIKLLFLLLLKIKCFISYNFSTTEISPLYDLPKYYHSQLPVFIRSTSTTNLNSSQQIPNYEWQVLKDFFYNTNGNYWIWQNESLSGYKWNFSSNYNITKPVCQWQGISCSCSNSTEYHPFMNDETVDGTYGAYTVNYYDDHSIDYIPTNITCNIDKIYLIKFNMTGVLPESIGLLTSLTHIHIVQNHLSGSIPNSLTLLTNLEIVGMFFNQLTGSIPLSIGNLINLNILILSVNQLSNKIPDSICNCNKLEMLILSSNKITSSIPQYIGLLNNLVFFFLRNNFLTSTLPSSIGDLTSLVYMSLHDNLLNKNLPDSIGNMTQLQYMLLENNKFTHTIPNTITKLVNLVNLRLDHNKLSGKIPSFIGNCVNLRYLELNDNQLSDIIPVSIVNLINLKVLFLNNNKLSGNLDNRFNASNHIYLNNVDVSKNFITGSLPYELFNCNFLLSFASYSNCMITNIPENICSLNSLNALILDGLRTAYVCQPFMFKLHNTFKFLPDTYQLESNVIQGGIPDCLFNMSNLESLHLSGNGITGSISQSVIVSSSLQALSLSHNCLSGKVPLAIQDRKWKQLQLSNNKFNGVISKNIPFMNSNCSIEYNENRISGYVPGSLHLMKNIKILSGNIFFCSIFNPHISLPIYDSDINNYQCGGNNFNFSIIVSSILILLMIIFKARLIRKLTKILYSNSETGVGFFQTLIKSFNKNLIQLMEAGKEFDNNNENYSRVSFHLDLGKDSQSSITQLVNLTFGLFKSIISFFLFIIVIWIPISYILSNNFSMYVY